MCGKRLPIIRTSTLTEIQENPCITLALLTVWILIISKSYHTFPINCFIVETGCVACSVCSSYICQLRQQLHIPFLYLKKLDVYGVENSLLMLSQSIVCILSGEKGEEGKARGVISCGMLD